MMKLTMLAVILATVLSQPVYSSEFLIRETDSAIIVEYSEEPDGKSADPSAARIATNKVGDSSAAKPVQVTAVPSQAASSVSPAEDDEQISERTHARAEAAAARAKFRAARMARASKYETNTSTLGDNSYFPPVYSQDEE